MNHYWLTHITFDVETISPQKCKQCAFNIKFLNITQSPPTNIVGLLVTNLMLLIPSRWYWQCNLMLNDAPPPPCGQTMTRVASISKYWQCNFILRYVEWSPLSARQWPLWWALWPAWQVPRPAGAMDEGSINLKYLPTSEYLHFLHLSNSFHTFISTRISTTFGFLHFSIMLYLPGPEYQCFKII